jgi:hypothetical protein
MKQKVNSYFAILIITISGSVATELIVHAANANYSGWGQSPELEQMIRGS